MKIVSKTTKPTREEIERRQVVADMILRKMSYGTFAVRKKLLAWLKDATRVTGFDLPTLKKMGLVKEASINGKIGAEMKALRKANAEIFEGLIAFPASELELYYNQMSLASLQRRYGTKVNDKDLGVVVQLKTARDIVQPTKPQINGWLRSKQNRATKEALQPVRETIRTKARRKFRKVRQSLNDYRKHILGFSQYVAAGLDQRREWVNAVEARTKTTQKMHNAD